MTDNDRLMKENYKIKVPATIANIVCGFDIMGMAVNEPYDEVSISLTDDAGVISIRHTDGFGLPEDPDKNVAGAALKALIECSGKQIGFDVEIHKNIMPGSGLGSSAASSVGPVMAANHLLNNLFTDQELLRFAVEGEFLASGSRHYDNIVPCLFGGITLISNNRTLKITPISYPSIWCTIVHPQIEVKTSDSRSIIKKEITVKKAIRQWSNIAGLVAGFFRKDYELIGESLEDVIFEPARSILIPAFSEVKAKSREAGALGGGISGSGPTIFMMSRDEATAKKVEDQMKKIYDQISLPYKTYVTTIKSTHLL